MSKTLYISTKNLPIRPATTFTIALVALLKAFGASRTVWAILLTLLVIIWIALITALFMTDTVELDMEKLAKDYKKSGRE